jgi:DNA-damage-inducible protein J
VDDGLLAQAQAVAADMGIDPASAVRLFLTQPARENGLPFHSYADPFFSAKNLADLQKSVAQLDGGQTITKTIDELETLYDGNQIQLLFQIASPSSIPQRAV